MKSTTSIKHINTPSFGLQMGDMSDVGESVSDGSDSESVSESKEA